MKFKELFCVYTLCVHIFECEHEYNGRVYVRQKKKCLKRGICAEIEIWTIASHLFTQLIFTCNFLSLGYTPKFCWSQVQLFTGISCGTFPLYCVVDIFVSHAYDDDDDQGCSWFCVVREFLSKEQDKILCNIATQTQLNSSIRSRKTTKKRVYFLKKTKKIGFRQNFKSAKNE